jgi:predicted ABC-type ATPase
VTSTINPKTFLASNYNFRFDDPGITTEKILSALPLEAADRLQSIHDRLANVAQTVDIYKKNGRYTETRSALHRDIVGKVLSSDRIKEATPLDDQPSFTILGGRAGSGKSWFKGKVYDPLKAIVLDADDIKAELPEYEGWNAYEVHEESGEIFDLITDIAKSLRLNIVHDATMKTPDKAIRLVEHFKGIGYKVDAFYMYLPRQLAAKRAISRFLGTVAGRYVPVEVILANTLNETSFDGVRPSTEYWQFRDNNVPQQHDPTLISEWH